MKQLFLLPVLSALVVFPLVSQNTVTDRIPLFKKGAIRVLILSGQNNHDWRSTTPFLRKLLLNTGRFDVRVNEEPTGMTAETLAIYDVVVLDYNGPRWGRTAENALADFIRSGKGLVGVHGANWAFSGLVVLGAHHIPTGIMEPPWPEYKQMIGGVWSDQPPASGHAPRHKFLVKIVDRDHPVTDGLPATFAADDELYHNMHMAPGVHVLATAFDDPSNEGSSAAARQPATFNGRPVHWPRLDMNPTGKNEPMLWTVHFGKGRTFYTTLGHDVKAQAMPGFSTTFVRGVEWAATGTVRKPEPAFCSWADPAP
ncbi:MAG TPA: ThuA domain-containing protein [Bryobacteraceae bacterium]|nr:ThuA domain-containing protein [Bryobacteraceae bacterium]